MIRKGWRAVSKNNELYLIFEEVVKEAKIIDKLFVTPRLFTSKMSTSIAKCCYSEWSTDIVISTYFMDAFEKNIINDSDVREIFVHEIGHALTEGERHNAKWKSVSNRLGKKWGIEVSRLCTNEKINKYINDIYNIKKQSSTYKYELYCPNCNAVWKYKTKCDAIKNSHRWHCAKCNSTLMSRAI